MRVKQLADTSAKLNVDAAPAVASQYGVRGIPTLILFKDGEEVNRFTGVQQENTLISAIETTLSENERKNDVDV